MKQGTVKFYNYTKGYGFIIDSETKVEYYVKDSGLIDDISKNDQVKFFTNENNEELNATQVQLMTQH